MQEMACVTGENRHWADKFKVSDLKEDISIFTERRNERVQCTGRQR